MRRSLLCLLLGVLGAECHGQDDLTVVSFNLWHGRKQLKQRTDATEHLLRRLRPDVVGLQEVSGSVWRRNRAKLLAGRLGYSFVYRPASGTRLVFREGLAALTRTPILRSGSRKLVHSRPRPFERRFVHWVEVALPSGQRVLVFNTHLTHHDHHGYQVERLEQALEVLQVVTREALLRDLPAVLLGDFNSEASHLAMRALTGRLLGGPPPFRDAWREAGRGAGVTDSPHNPHNDSDDLALRIDYILLLNGTRRTFRTRRVELIGDRPEPTAPNSGRLVIPSNHYGLWADLSLGRGTSRVGARGRLRGRLRGRRSIGVVQPGRRTAASRAARLLGRIDRLQKEIATIRSQVVHELELEQEANRWDEDGAPVWIDPAEVRRRVLSRVLARHP